mgnify:CR=1 FL=1
MVSFSKIFLVLGGVFLFLGVLFFLLGHYMPSFSFGKLPGDITIRTKKGVFFFPFTSMVLISLVLSAISFILRFLRK